MNTGRFARYSAPLSVAAILSLCLMEGLPTIASDQYFLADDFGLVQHLHAQPLAKFFSYFASDWTEGIYGMPLDELRPLLGLSYRLDAALWGAANAAGYHLSNVLLHAAAALLVCAIARSVAGVNPWTGLLAGSLFALLPAHAEPVAWISGRVDPLAAIFYFAAFLCYVRSRPRAGLLLFCLGLFAKQSVVTLPILLVGYDLVTVRRLRLARVLPFFAALFAYLALRRFLFGSALRENTLHPGLLVEFLRRQAFYLYRLLPFSPEDPLAAKVALASIALAIFGTLIWTARRPLRTVLFFGPVWYVVTIAPMIVTYASARHLYLTAGGLCIAAAILLATPEVSRTRLAVCALLLLLYGAALSRSLQPWLDNGRYSATVSAQLPAALRSIPPDSTVLLAIPALRRHTHFWDFALPFALKAPFTQEDLYRRATIIEPDPVYCCPAPQWWSHVRPALDRAQPVYVVSADPITGRISTTRRTIGPDEIPRQPILTPADAYRVSRALFPELPPDN